MVDDSLTSCVRRAADTNRFIAEEGDLSLREICASAPEQQLLRSLLGLCSHKSAGMRTKTFLCIVMFLQRLGSSAVACRQVGALNEAIGKATKDANPDVRAAAKTAAALLVAETKGKLTCST